MAEDVEASRNHLPLGDTVGVSGVHQREAGIELGIIPPCFDFLFLVGDNRAAVAFATGAGDGNDNAQRQRFKIHDAGPRPEVLPDVPVVPGSQRYRLAAVHHTAAADGEDHIHPVLPGQLGALLHFGVGGVGHDTVKLHNGFARLFQHAGDFIIHAVALDRAAAIGQQDGVRVFGQTDQVFLYTALAEIHLGGVLKNKIVHKVASFLFSACLNGASALPKKRPPDPATLRRPCRYPGQSRGEGRDNGETPWECPGR